MSLAPSSKLLFASRSSQGLQGTGTAALRSRQGQPHFPGEETLRATQLGSNRVRNSTPTGGCTPNHWATRPLTLASRAPASTVCRQPPRSQIPLTGGQGGKEPTEGQVEDPWRSPEPALGPCRRGLRGRAWPRGQVGLGSQPAQPLPYCGWGSPLCLLSRWWTRRPESRRRAEGGYLGRRAGAVQHAGSPSALRGALPLPPDPQSHLVDGPQPQPRLAALVLAQVDLAHPGLDLPRQHAQAVPGHRRHHLVR